MTRVLIHDLFNHSKTQWLLEKRNEEADNLVRYLYNLCSNGGSEGKVVNVRTAAQHYWGSVMRRMMFNLRFYGKGNEDGGPGVEEQENVSALYTMLLHLYAFSVADYLPWLRVFDLGEHEKKVKEAMEVLKKYQEVIVNERVQLWREGRRKEAEDLHDVFITLKDEIGNLVLSDEEIKAQITQEILPATVDNPANAAEWALSIDQNNLKKQKALRLHPVAPFNLPDLSVSDCVVAGYFIPKGSRILLSRLGLGRNPKVWEDPFRFDPERRLKEGVANQQVSLAEPELRFITFTIGRRSCLGGWRGSTITVMLFIQGFTWSMPPGVEKIDLTEANSLLKEIPLHALAKPRLPPSGGVPHQQVSPVEVELRFIKVTTRRVKLLRQLVREDNDDDAVIKASSRVYMEHATRCGKIDLTEVDLPL
ncbi:hypothetical protein FEM48_Zijuj02G0041500 [Ziziphus jujuba var. spinosa]|uniref:Isoleucine N-monooxygenase 2-like n=1 Tax=Ziziphus jujuba var. spinosa TaxID=714518 RepID=A0A978VTJ3_ZIZJJ|nr:hypothetical protein FEM48_Zijuj02G0041500 [Ziziphus jujuba var. spinosa]